MRTTGALVVLILLGIISFGNNVKAENNPLLTIYESIELGMDADVVNNAAENFVAWSELSVYKHFLPLSLTYDDAFIIWKWVEPNYQNRYQAPTASLEIHSAARKENEPKITRIIYRYHFLLLDKILEK